MAGLVLATMLTGCDGVVQVAQTHANAAQESAAATHAEAEALRLSADAQHIQAQTDAATAKALIDQANARADDLRLLVALVACLAAASMGMSAAVFMWARNQVRQPPPPPVAYYQIGPGPLPNPPQIGAHQSHPTPFDLFLQERARRRALLAARNEGARIL